MRIHVTITDELAKLVLEYAKKHQVTEREALAHLAAKGAGLPVDEAIPQHGGKRKGAGRKKETGE